MFLLRARQSVCIVSLLCIFSQLAEARDVSALQTALALARQDMERAKESHEAGTQAIIEQQRIIAEHKKKLAEESRQLDEMQKDVKRAWKQYLAAKQKYEKAQSTLNAAWGKE